MVLSEINAALSLWERIARWWHARNNPPVESVAARFVRLFESHEVHRNQIPRFFGHGLTLKDVQDDASLLAKLDETVLNAACERFAVRREWLDGAKSQVYPHHDFYKHPERVADFLKSLKTANPDGQLDGVLIAPDEPKGDALLILQEIIGAVGDKPIYRYHLCNNWRFSYWKSRAYLTAVAAIAWKQDVCVRGVYQPKNKIEQLATGDLLLGQGPDGICKFVGKKWYPEEMALKPDDFLRGVNREQDNFGVQAGLKLWLELELQGYMGTGLEMYKRETVRQLFQQELANYLPASGTKS